MDGKELLTPIRDILTKRFALSLHRKSPIFKFTGFAVKTPLSVVYPTHTGG